MQYSWIVLIPPLLVLATAIATRKVKTSLIVGILSASLITSNFSLIKTATHITTQCRQQILDASNLYMFAFLLLLGLLITLINKTGGTTAYGNLIKKLLKNQRSSKLSSIVLSLFFTIDDFFSSLTVGCIMRPITDSFKIPRAKLAFLIDSLAAPLVIIAPISTWIAMLLMQLNKAGISLTQADNPVILVDPFIAYLHIIPFVFYSFAIMTSTWLIVVYPLSFGPMRKHEEIALATGNLFGGKPPVKSLITPACTTTGSIIDFLMPIGSLIGCILATILYTGNSALLGGTNSLLQTIQRSDIFMSLFIGCCLANIISFVSLILRRQLSIDLLIEILKEGFFLMLDSLIILFLAWIFSSILKNDLHTGNYIAHILVGKISSLMLPGMFFIASLATSFATGSSWGTITIMIPIAIPMLVSFFNLTPPVAIETLPLLYPTIGAIFAGSVASDHLSPLAPTTTMSATSAGCYLNDHIYTQLPYALPALIGTALAYFVYPYLLLESGSTHAFSIAFFIVIFTTITGLLVSHYCYNYFFPPKSFSNNMPSKDTIGA